MDTIALTVQARDAQTAAKQLRKDNIVPCVLYGNEVENTALQCDHNELYRTYAKAGESTLVELVVGEKTVPVLIHDIDFHPVSDRILHVDFYAVDMKKEIEAHVPIHYNGTAPAVKDLGGVLVTTYETLTVKCLPANLPHALEVDVSPLATFQDSLHVSDVQIPEQVAVAEDPNTVIATVQEPRAVIEETAAEEAAEEGEGEGEAKAAADEAAGDGDAAGGEDKSDA